MPEGQFTSCRCGVRYANESLTHFMGRDRLAPKSPDIRTACRRCYQSVLWATSGWFGMHSSTSPRESSLGTMSRSRSLSRPQRKIDSISIYVAVNFLFQLIFIFPLF